MLQIIIILTELRKRQQYHFQYQMHESDAETNNIPLSSLACFLHDVKCWHVQRESESDSYDFHKTSKLPNAKFVKFEMK